MKKKRKSALYVAVVTRADGSASKNLHKTWSSFIGSHRDKLIEKALKSMFEWERDGAGPYMLLVGKLDSRVTVPASFKVVPL